MSYGSYLNRILERFYRYEWDEAKNAGNVEKHKGFELSDGIAVFLDNAKVIKKDERFDYGESRYIVIGNVDGTVLFVCFTPRGFFKRRLISVRRASKQERREYYGK